MDFKELEKYLDNLADEVIEDVAEIVAEAAVEYFKESFSKKAFDGEAWVKPKKSKNTGSLLIESGALLNSIQPALISKELVIIQAGNDKVDYAKAHNGGCNEIVNVPAHTRKSSNVKEHTRKGKTIKAHTRKGGDVAAHSMRMHIPKRQFLGEANELANAIYKQLQLYLNSIEK